jgi:RecB family exonuclease
MRVPFPDGPSVTGILDRVDLEPGSGEWVVVDYKTGGAPPSLPPSFPPSLRLPFSAFSFSFIFQYAPYVSFSLF